ncbi:MAG: hypothetical protein KDH88_03350 [Chromatiales bacterium]|nr:hypothetical protein [Chromatiales bacterium]
MNLTLVVEDTAYELNVPESIVQGATDFFAKLDADMDQGWMVGRTWVQQPGTVERCQVVADKLLTAMETENNKLGMMMAAYLLHKMPGVNRVDVDVQGELQNTQFTVSEPMADTAPPPEATPAIASKPIHSRLDAIEQAGREVSKVYKKGRAWSFALYDAATQRWNEMPAVKTEDEANRLRMQTYEDRLQELLSKAR